MNDIFFDCIDSFLLVYDDDLLIYSQSEEDHLKHLKIGLDQLSATKFKSEGRSATFSDRDRSF